MKKFKRAASVLCIVTFLVWLFNTAGLVYDSFFYQMDDLPQGEFLYSSMSPDGTYTLKMYRVQNNLGTAVRGELVRLENGQPVSENIYWQVGTDQCIAGWINDTVVSINNISLNVQNPDTFDSRRKTTLNQVW